MTDSMSRMPGVALPLFLVILVLFYATPSFADPFSFKVNGKEMSFSDLFGGDKKKEEKQKKPKKRKPKQNAKPAPRATPAPIEDDFLAGSGGGGGNAAAPQTAHADSAPPPASSGSVASGAASTPLATSSGSATSAEAVAKNRAGAPGIPVIQGLSIGMTPAEVKESLKQWRLTRDDVRYIVGGAGYDYRSDEVSIRRVTGWIPNRTKRVNALFSPSFPGEERLMQINMSMGNERGKRPSAAAFEKAIINRFGQPTLADKKYSRQYWWVYDIDGHPMKNIKTSTSTLGQCSGRTRGDGLQRQDKKAMARSIYDIRSHCGSYTLYIRASLNSSLVSSYNVALYGNEEYIGSAVATRKRIGDILRSRQSDASDPGDAALSGL